MGDKNITSVEQLKEEEEISFIPRILTGDRPTGKLHLGHLVGTLQERVRLQDLYDTFILIADLQVPTDHMDEIPNIERNTREIMLDYLSVGLKPEKNYVIQSQVPELQVLTYYLNYFVTVARAQRNPTLKDEAKRYGVERMSMAMLDYPISQGADILLFKGTLVPVGQDQVPHLEQSREIARDFNRFAGRAVFPVPNALVGKCPSLPGIDGDQKMSKSSGNAINLSDPVEMVTKKVMKMVSQSEPGNPDKSLVFTYHRLFNSDQDEVRNLEDMYRQKTIGDKVAKERLAIALNRMLDPIRERRADYEARPKDLTEILVRGRDRAKEIGQATIKEVLEAMKLPYRTLLPQ